MTFEQFISSFYLAIIAITIAMFNTVISVDVDLQKEIGIMILIPAVVFMAYAAYTSFSKKSLVILQTILTGLFSTILIVGIYLHFGMNLGSLIEQAPQMIFPAALLFILFMGLQKITTFTNQCINASAEANSPKPVKIEIDKD